MKGNNEKDIDNRKLKLDKEELSAIEHAEKMKANRDLYKYELLIDVIFDQLNPRVKNEYLNIYKTNENSLKVYIAEYVRNVSQSILSDGYSDISEKDQFNNKYRVFINNIKVQKNRWLKREKDNLANKDNKILEFKDKYYPNETYAEFETIIKEKLSKWRHNSSCYMIDFPLYECITNIRSKKSLFTYDIGFTVYNIMLKFFGEDTIYRHIDYLIPIVSSYTKATPKYNLIPSKNDNGSDVMIERETIIDNSDTYAIKEQVSIFDNVDNDTKEELKELLRNELNSDVKIFLNKLVKKNQMMFQPFDNQDIEIFAASMNKIDSNFYIDRKIKCIANDILEDLGKDPTQGKNKRWLKNKYNKMQGKNIILIAKDHADGEIVYEKFSIVQEVVFYTKNKQSIIELTVSDKVYNDILKEDTINVYKKDFLTIKNSKFPDAVVLIFNFQLLRISAYQRGKNNMKVSTSFFVNSLNIKEKSNVKIKEIITDYINLFITKKVIVKAYEYVPKQQAWYLQFFDLTTKDLTSLVNIRKNYTSVVEKTIPFLKS